jgi:hypothetical protein
MSQLIIASTLPFLFAQRVTDQERAWIKAHPTGMASRQYEQTSETRETISLRTAQGDTVSLQYRSAAVRKNYLRPEGTLMPGLEDSVTIAGEVSVAIDGEINAEEQQDISTLFERLGNKEGGIDVNEYSSLSGYEKEVDTNGSTAWADEMVVGDPVSVPGGAEPDGPGFLQLLQQSDFLFRNQLKNLFLSQVAVAGQSSGEEEPGSSVDTMV